MIKIEFNNKQIFITEDHSTLVDEYGIDNCLFIFDFKKNKLQYCFDLLLISDVENLILVGNETEILEIISNNLKLIKAGGGIVKNSRNAYLFIYRRHKWDLPKGKMEENEDMESCAVREVMEETGLRQVEIIRLLTKTYHIYMEEEFIFKETYWYLMHSDDVVLHPQLEEGIQKAVWINTNNIAFQLKNTYKSIKDIFSLVS